MQGHTLNDGHALPGIGFGTHPLRGDEARDACLSAIAAGYRLIDSATNYENEADVGRAVRECGLDRDQLIVTSKLPGRHHAYDHAIRSCRESLERSGLDRWDLYLIHWPNPITGRYVEAWQALVDLREAGLIRSIGVSNFTREHLERIIDATGVVPAVNQIEIHPYFPQDDMLAVHQDMGIVTESWSPLGKDPLPFDETPVVAASQVHGVTPAQVVLRWHLQRGALPLPKSADVRRQRENLDLGGFELSDDEVCAITALGRDDGRRFDGDPETHEEM